MQYVVWHCHVGKCKVFPERDDVWMGAYVVLELGYTFQRWWSSIGGIGDPLPILTSERHCHSERLFLYPIMLPIDLISCKLVLQLFLICTFNFSGLLLLPVPTFLECVALMKSKMSQYLAWHFKMSHFQHLICYLLELSRILGWNEYPVRIKHFCRVRVSYE